MIECIQITKQFGHPPQTVLHNINLQIKDAEFVSISGKSGSGKSTLLYILSTLDSPSSGQVFFDGQNIKDLTSDQLHQFRNKQVGFVFQFHYLLPELTALENVLLPARNLSLEKSMKEHALRLLEELDVLSQKDKLPSQMSGGQQQRVAIARALAMRPRYLFADEPTGNLDSKNGVIVMDILKRVNKEFGTTISLVTHEPTYSQRADREIYLIDGRISQREKENPTHAP